MPSQFSIVLSGNYAELVAARKLAMLQGMKAATIAVSTDVKTKTRNDMRRAGYKGPIINTIQDAVYPSGQTLSYTPSAQVFSTAPNIIAPAALGLRVTPQTADSLVIPLSDSPAKSLKRRRGQTLVEAARAKYGRLQKIERAGKSSLLGAKIRGSDGKDVLTPLFTLAKSATHQKKLRTLEIFEQARTTHPRAVLFKLVEYLDASTRETAIN